jgi:two-component system response regulator ChvI
MTSMERTQTGISKRVAASARKGNAAPAHILLVDDNDLFRESLSLALRDRGYAVTSFSSGPLVLEYFAAGGRADVVMLDWRMPEMNGLEILRNLRRLGNSTPVIFLTALSEDIYEEAALESGAVDFIAKSRGLSIVVKRLQLIAEGTRPVWQTDEWHIGDVLQFGRLELRFDSNRANWAGRDIDLTLTEFKIVALLALRMGQDVSYREIYDLVHHKNFKAGYGDDDFRANLRSFIKRIRKKLRAVDPECEHIRNYASFGYRWVDSVHAESSRFAEREPGAG